jgi:hypothetical protein
MVRNDSERDEGRLERRGHEIFSSWHRNSKAARKQSRNAYTCERPSSGGLSRADALASLRQTGLAITKQPRLCTEHSGPVHALKAAHSATRTNLHLPPPLTTPPTVRQRRIFDIQTLTIKIHGTPFHLFMSAPTWGNMSYTVTILQCICI